MNATFIDLELKLDFVQMGQELYVDSMFLENNSIGNWDHSYHSSFLSYHNCYSSQNLSLNLYCSRHSFQSLLSIFKDKVRFLAKELH